MSSQRARQIYQTISDNPNIPLAWIKTDLFIMRVYSELQSPQHCEIHLYG